MTRPALLALEDGSIFHGTAIGDHGYTTGEVVFNTAMTGYQEILTDPSYAQQIVTLTYPHIGNVGANSEDRESNRAWAAGLIIRDLPLLSSNFREEQTLAEYLQSQHIIAIADVDTRRLTRLLREKGALSGCIMADEVSVDQALSFAQNFPGLTEKDLAQVVSTQTPYTWTQGTWRRGSGYHAYSETDLPYHVVVYDFGVKQTILRQLVEVGCHLTVVPAQTPPETVWGMRPHGVVFSNGPGDPAACDYAIQAIRVFLDHDLPLLGICLGHQLLGLACGARTRKMKFGHHGANHPVQDLRDHSVWITSQNHGFAVDEETLPSCLEATHRSLFDGSLQGIRHIHKPAFSFQGHPEASPGPHEASRLFAEFVDLLR